MKLNLIKNNIFYCGVKDKDRKLFDQLVPLPQGTTYNSYLVVGSEKTALIDTTYPPKINELITNLDENGIKKIDYIIANHGEQDHTGALPTLIKIYPDAKIITNEKCKNIIVDMLHVSEGKFIVINDGDEVPLGDKTLKFILAPWVHWPDTMFTYIKEDKMLFTCDFLGAHYTSYELYSDNSPALEASAKRYYAEIMMPFRTFAAKYVQLIKSMEIDMILPSHGPIYKDFQFIVDLYEDWTSDKVDNLVVIPYVSMYDSTKLLAEHLTKSLKDKGINVELMDVVNGDHGDLAMKLVNAATVVLGSSMVLAGPHPEMISTAYLIALLRPKMKNLGIIGSYGWGGNLTGKLEEMFATLKPEKFDYVVIKGAPKEEDFKKIDNLADAILTKHKDMNLI